MSDIPELLPCPFCGGEAKHNSGGNSRYGRLWWSVGCDNCGVEMYDHEVWDGDRHGMFHPDHKPMECFENWNTRTAPQVKPLVWGDMEWDQDEYGCQEWGEFTSGLISMSKCHTYAIYQFSDSEYMWTSGTLDNMRYSTYRPLNDPNWVPAIPWYSTPEGAKEGALAALEKYALSLLER